MFVTGNATHMWCGSHLRRADRSRGSMALEAALALPVAMLLIVFLIAAINLVRFEIMLASALDNTAEELALLLPVVELVAEKTDLSETVQNLFSDWTDGTDLDLSDMLGQASLDLASSVVSGYFIDQRNRYWLRKESESRSIPLNLLEDSSILLSWHIESNYLLITQRVRLKSPLGLVHRSSKSIVPLWVGRLQEETNSTNAENDSIWMLDNFSRGRALRDHYGGNLPFNYPVIAAFEAGTAISMISMDLTAPSYQKEGVVTGEVIKRIQEKLDQLAAFSGHQSNSETYPNIVSSEIHSKKLLLIIPQNSPQAFFADIRQSLYSRAAAQGIALEIVQHGTSVRYQEQEDS